MSFSHRPIEYTWNIDIEALYNHLTYIFMNLKLCFARHILNQDRRSQVQNQFVDACTFLWVRVIIFLIIMKFKLKHSLLYKYKSKTDVYSLTHTNYPLYPSQKAHKKSKTLTYNWVWTAQSIFYTEARRIRKLGIILCKMKCLHCMREKTK